MSTFTDVVISTVALEVITPSDPRPDFSTQGTVNTLISNSQFITATAPITASTTHTLAGATPIVTPTAIVTVSNASDSVFLPAAVLGVEYTIINTSATLAGTLFAAGGSTINGTAGATGVALTANSVTLVYGAAAGVYITK